MAFIDSSLSNIIYRSWERGWETKGEFCAMFYDTTRFETKKIQLLAFRNSRCVSVGWDAALERICTYGLFIEKLSGNGSSIHI